MLPKFSVHLYKTPLCSMLAKTACEQNINDLNTNNKNESKISTCLAFIYITYSTLYFIIKITLQGIPYQNYSHVHINIK